MHIFDLPLDVLKVLCQYFPLMALYSLAEAAGPFSDFVILLREQVLPARRSLTLFVGPVETEEKKIEEEVENENDGVSLKKMTSSFCTFSSSSCYFDLLHFDQLTVDRSQWLIEKLPNIRQLTVSVRKSDSSIVPLIISLITAWSPKLTDLTLYINLQKREEESSLAVADRSSCGNASRLHALILAINLYCTWLCRLRVHLFDQKLFPFVRFIYSHRPCHPRLYLPILGQLKSFSFSSGDSIVSLLESLSRWAVANSRLENLEIGCRLEDKETLLKLIEKCPQEFTRKFCRLGDDQFLAVANDENFFNQLTHAFIGLVELRLQLFPLLSEMNGIPYKELLTPYFLERTFLRLAMLNRLEKLEIVVQSVPDTFKWQELSTTFQMSSVTSLTLTTVTNSHYDLSFFPVHKLFPHLEHFILAIDERLGIGVKREKPRSISSINHFHCHRCKWWTDVLLAGDTSSFDRCTQKAFRCLKRCPNLKTIRLQLSGGGGGENGDKHALPFLPPGSYKQLWLPEEIR